MCKVTKEFNWTLLMKFPQAKFKFFVLSKIDKRKKYSQKNPIMLIYAHFLSSISFLKVYYKLLKRFYHNLKTSKNIYSQRILKE